MYISLIADIKVIGESIEKTVVDAIEVVTE
jgi:hypothetical protein